MTKSYRLPDGSITSDVNLYADTWFALANQVAALFPGYQVNGVDPGISLASSDWKSSLSLTVEQANALLAEVKRQSEPEADDAAKWLKYICSEAAEAAGWRDKSPAHCAAHIKNLILNLKTEARVDRKRIEAAGRVLSYNGCDCECGCDSDGHDEDCDLCLACSIGEALSI